VTSRKLRFRLRWFQFMCLATMPTLIIWGAQHNLWLALSATAMLAAIVGSLECILTWTDRIMEVMSTYKNLLSSNRALTRTMIEVAHSYARKEDSPRRRPSVFN
jgi:hypothetical protein